VADASGYGAATTAITNATAKSTNCATCLKMRLEQLIIVNHHFTCFMAKTEEV